jgi:hypothetical protein
VLGFERPGAGIQPANPALVIASDEPLAVGGKTQVLETG